jgi:hypothetical protein
MKRSVILILVSAILLSLDGFAQTIGWCIPPEYDDLKPYSETIYYCCKGDKWGLVSTSGKVLVPPTYDFISAMVDGYAVAGVKENSKNRISCIINSKYEITPLKEALYLTNKYYTYFSEDKLPVANKSGKQGFINVDGTIVVKCQFDNVHPFSEGYASVSKYPNAFYITERYDRNHSQSVLPVDFNYGELTFASTFYNGRAVVAYNNKSAVINTSGQKVDKYNGKISSSCYNKYDYTIRGCGSTPRSEEYKSATGTGISIFEENGEYGYSKDGKVLVYPSLSKADPFTVTGYAVAVKNGMTGLLQFIKGDVNTYVAKQKSKDPYTGAFNASSNKYSLVVSLPENVRLSDYSVYLNAGDGTLKKVSPHLTDGLWRVDFTPELPSAKADNVTIVAEVRACDAVVNKFSHSFTVKSKSGASTTSSRSTMSTTSTNHSLKISGPATQTSSANDKDMQVVYATITNTSANSVKVTATLSISSKNVSTKQSYTIPAGSSKTITVSVKVLKRESVKATLTLSTGQTSTKQVLLNPYY